MTNLTPEQMMADVKLLRAALTYYSNNAQWHPNDGTTPTAKEALAATDRPEYKEEG